MADTDTTISLRDASLEEQVRALVADIPDNPERIEVVAYDDADDPYHLWINLYATTEAQRDEWVAEVRQRLADELNVSDAPLDHELEDLTVA